MENITVVIVTFNTPEGIILNCLKSIDKEIKIIIVENSDNFLLKNLILSQFKNVKISCSGKNLGYGSGNNFGLDQVKTDYALILNPDTICDEEFFKNMTDIINETQNFSIIGCHYLNEKNFIPAGFFDTKKNNDFRVNYKDNNIEDLAKVEWVTGQSMLINLKKFQNTKIFDENFFLYFEEFDLCKSLISKGENIFTSKKLKIKHLGFKSSFDEDSIYKINVNRLKEWHWMWSTFYFYKKNYNYLFALKKVMGKFFTALFKIIFFSITFNKKGKEKYKYRFLGIYSAIMGHTSYFRDNLK